MTSRRLEHELVALERLCAACADRLLDARTLIVAAHPDDEVIGAGARLRSLADVVVLHVTDGAPRNLEDARASGHASREAYALARRQELLSALRLADVSADRALSLDCVDQQASLHIAELASAIASLIERSAPHIVLTHPYEGGHPDHDAAAASVHLALRLLSGRGCALPALLEFTSYHAREGRLTPFEFLPSAADTERTIVLSHEDRTLKAVMLGCYVSQARTLAQFPVAIEKFRVAPAYDFTSAPHEGTLYYEQFDWGMTGARFRSLAARATQTLELDGSRCR